VSATVPDRKMPKFLYMNSRVLVFKGTVLPTGCFKIIYLHKTPNFTFRIYLSIRTCGIVDRFPVYRSRGPGSIPSITRFSEK
jgi:hypothetical protein